MRTPVRAQMMIASGWVVVVTLALFALVRGGTSTAWADPPKRADPDVDLDVRDLDPGQAAPAPNANPNPDDDELSVTRCPIVSGTTCGERGVPAVDEVVTAAYAAAGLAGDPASAWVRRGRLAALVPWLTVRAGRDVTWQDNDPDVGRSQTYEVRATWRLDRLAFDARELQVASLESARRREKRRLAARVVRVYFTWLRTHRATARDPRWALHAAESAAELDALTGGAFTRALRTGAHPPSRVDDGGAAAH